MSMGYGANFAEVIEDKDLKKLCPKEFKALINALDQSDEGHDLESFARALAYDEELDENVMSLYENLKTAFEKKTKLSLGLAFHDKEDDGDRYDEINGAYWNVSEMYQLSPAGKKLSKYVQRKFFVTFG